MPRYGRARGCAFADPEPLAPKLTKAKTVLTPEEKAAKKKETLRRAEMRKKKWNGRTL